VGIDTELAISQGTALSLERILFALEKAVADWPAATSLLFERAKALDALRREELAEAAYLAVLTRNPRHFRALNDLGMLYHRNGLVPEATRCFELAVEADPNNATGEANLGFMLFAVDDLPRARAHFERALTLKPDHPGASAGLAEIVRQE
jgi:tetratricopeptide (TPR) repeat protein